MTVSDLQLYFSSAQAITTTAISTNTLDMEAIRDIGNGNQLVIKTIVTTSFADSSTNSALAVFLAVSSTAGTQGVFHPAAAVATTPAYGFALDTSAALSIAPPGQLCFVIPAASVAGSGPYYCYINPGAITQRYIALIYVPLSGDLTSGAVTSFIAPYAGRANYAPAAFTIS